LGSEGVARPTGQALQRQGWQQYEHGHRFAPVKVASSSDVEAEPARRVGPFGTTRVPPDGGDLHAESCRAGPWWSCRPPSSPLSHPFLSASWASSGPRLQPRRPVRPAVGPPPARSLSLAAPRRPVRRPFRARAAGRGGFVPWRGGFSLSPPPLAARRRSHACTSVAPARGLAASRTPGCKPWVARSRLLPP